MLCTGAVAAARDGFAACEPLWAAVAAVAEAAAREGGTAAAAAVHAANEWAADTGAALRF